MHGSSNYKIPRLSEFKRTATTRQLDFSPERLAIQFRVGKSLNSFTNDQEFSILFLTNEKVPFPN